MYLISKKWHWYMNTMVATIVKPVTFHTSGENFNKKYYDALGISPNSTQNDIKSAYYRLSKLYHPDKNMGCENTAIKFREITQAYEVLGNYRLRRLYDKGIIHTAGSQYAQRSDYSEDFDPEIEDDAETRFYKSRFKKSTVSDSRGRTPIYDFDEWSRNHYGQSFERRQRAKSKYDSQENHKVESIKAMQTEIILFSILAMMVMAYLIFHAESSYDTPRNLKDANTDKTNR